jgi:hypothetical protein
LRANVTDNEKLLLVLFMKQQRLAQRIFDVILTILDFILFGLSITICTLLIFIWAYAYLYNLIPEGPWGVYDGNHGPWRGFLLDFINPQHPLNILRQTLTWIFFLQFFSLFLSAGCLVLECKRNRGILLLLNGMYFFALVNTYYWLID